MRNRKNLKSPVSWQICAIPTSNNEYSPIYFAQDGFFFKTTWDKLRFELPEFPFEQAEPPYQKLIAYFENYKKNELTSSIEINSYQGIRSSMFNQFYIHTDGSILASGENRLGSLGVGIRPDDIINSRRIHPVIGLPNYKIIKKMVADLSGTIIIMNSGLCYASGDIFYRPEGKYHTTFHLLEFCKNKMIVDAHLMSNNIYLYNSYTPEPVCVTPQLNKALQKAKENHASEILHKDEPLSPIFNLPNDMINVTCQSLTYHSVRSLRMTSRFFRNNEALTKLQNNKKEWEVYIDDYDIILSHQNKTFNLDQSAEGFSLYPHQLTEKKWAELEKPKNILSSRFLLGYIYSGNLSGNRFFLSQNGKVLAQGENRDGSLGLATKDRSDQTFIVRDLPNDVEVLTIAGSEHRTFFIMKNGQCYVCGNNAGRYLGILDGNDTFKQRNINKPTLLKTDIKIKNIFLLDNHALVLDDNDHLYRTGSSTLTLTPLLTDEKVTAIYVRNSRAIIKTASSNMYAYSTYIEKPINIKKLLDVGLKNPEKLRYKYVNK